MWSSVRHLNLIHLLHEPQAHVPFLLSVCLFMTPCLVGPSTLVVGTSSTFLLLQMPTADSKSESDILGFLSKLPEVCGPFGSLALLSFGVLVTL